MGCEGRGRELLGAIHIFGKQHRFRVELCDEHALHARRLVERQLPHEPVVDLVHRGTKRDK